MKVTHFYILSCSKHHFEYQPIGSTPASINVAMVKLASTKRKRMAQHGGTAGQMVTASHGHLNMQTQEKEEKNKKGKLFTVLITECSPRAEFTL